MVFLRGRSPWGLAFCAMSKTIVSFQSQGLVLCRPKANRGLPNAGVVLYQSNANRGLPNAGAGLVPAHKKCSTYFFKRDWDIIEGRHKTGPCVRRNTA